MKSENRYMIGEQECFVTFDDSNCPIEGETCLLRIGNKIFRIAVRLLKIIASPAP